MNQRETPSREAQSLLETARRSPRDALTQGAPLLQGMDPDDHVSRATALWAIALAARSAGDNRLSISCAKDGIAEAGRAGDGELAGKISVTLSGSLALAGDNAQALEILGALLEVADGQAAAEIEFQRGAVLSRMGEMSSALRSYSVALPIFKVHRDHESIGMTLHNSGLLHVYAGELDLAQSALEDALRIHTNLGNSAWAAAAQHNLGMVAACEVTSQRPSASSRKVKASSQNSLDQAPKCRSVASRSCSPWDFSAKHSRSQRRSQATCM